MPEISQRQQKILTILLKRAPLSSSEIHRELLKERVSLVTVKRELSRMVEIGLVASTGKGRSLVYDITATGRIFSDVDVKVYCAIEPDKRYGLDRFNFEILPALTTDIFTEEELLVLENSTGKYRQRTADVSPAMERKELERLIIELSWKSSKIEGNTYTLLDTERLILKNEESPGHKREEAVMILNHKNAFIFAYENRKEFTTLTKDNLEALHGILVADLNINLGLRKRPVGVTASKYRPLDNMYQVREAVDTLIATVSRMKTPYAKALAALVGISYIQPFEDGNKRTARLMANALLLAHKCAPLSYRSVEEEDYREAALVFYELNSIISFKRIFVEQYKFATEYYAVK